MKGRRAWQRDVKKGGRGRGMGGRRVGQMDGKKVGMGEGWEKGGWGRGM